MASFDYDVVIIGSGFGGSVAALRAAEKGYRVGVMESGKRWKDEDIPKSQWHLPDFLWFPAAELYGIQRVEYLDDVLVLSGAGVGGGSHVYANTLYVPPKQFFDAPEWASITDWADELAPHHRPGDADARRRSLPVHAHRRRSRHAAGRDRDGTRGDVQQGAGGRLLRQPGRRGRRSVLRRGRAAAHRLHLVRQVQHRLRPQRQEQADDELPLPGGEARRRGPRAARGVRPRPARRRRVRGAHASSRLGAASRASPPSHLHRRAGDRRRPRVRLGEAPAAHAAQGPPDGPLERARPAGADELRAAARDHADARRVEARSGEDPPHAGVGVDHLRRLAGSGDEHRARLLGRRERPVRVPGHLPPARRAEAPDRGLAQGAGRAPDRGAQLRRPARLGRADGHHAVLADDRHLDRAVLARRPAAEPAHRHASRRCTSRSSRSSSTGWRRRWTATRGRCRSRSSTAPPRPTSPAGSRSATAARAAPSTPTSACSASRACTSWTEA